MDINVGVKRASHLRALHKSHPSRNPARCRNPHYPSGGARDGVFAHTPDPPRDSAFPAVGKTPAAYARAPAALFRLHRSNVIVT